MKFSIFFLVILSIIALFVQSSYSKSIYISKKKYINRKNLIKNKKVIDKKKVNKLNKGKKIEKKDQFYIILLNNPYNNDTTINSKRKRDLNNIFVEGIVSDIHNLIVENKDTYNDPQKLQQLDDENAQRKKRGEISLDEESIGDSNYVYKISSTENETALYAYLSNDIASTVNTMTNIKTCVPDDPNKIKFTGIDEDIKRETGWKNVLKQANSYNYLSLISQGKFDDKLISKYDDTYYYPKSGGAGVNVIVCDRGFNFKSSNLQGRGKCWLYIKEGKAYYYSSGTTTCYSERNKGTDVVNHGTKISHIIGGKQSGVAPNVNILGIVFETGGLGDLYKALSVLSSERNLQTKVVNLSLAVDENPQNVDSRFSYLENLVNSISVNSIIVSSAGNEARPANGEMISFPCVYENAICVGGIDNGKSGLKTMTTQNYRKWPDSNYGKEVNIYAPVEVNLSYLDSNNKSVSKTVSGTSYSTALVSGVISLFLSEGIKLETMTFQNKLSIIGIPNIISGLPSGSNNLFLNNGKRTVYSKDNRYNTEGCGPNVGNKKCPAGSCCSQYGYCGTSNDHCKVGCQSKFGTCKK